MAVTQDRVEAGTALRLDSVRRFSLPVSNLDRAELFYTHVIGAKFLRRTEPAQVSREEAAYPELHVNWAGIFDVQLVKQGWGEPTLRQAHPHHAFSTKGSQIDRWQDHLKSWGVPSVIVCRQHGKKGLGDVCSVELYFHDPDGNPLELDANDYIFSERTIWAPYDHADIEYHGSHWWDEHKGLFTPHS
ncbi:MAG: hypothetical protein QOF51_1064 [Chloroflexota bacterium]|jgi:catechol 2,3-dioxygenase-like lactoylglutathione lyase family enzyme|nr:hypothetical protein [Chloroflexota bacterium]